MCFILRFNVPPCAFSCFDGIVVRKRNYRALEGKFEKVLLLVLLVYINVLLLIYIYDIIRVSRARDSGFNKV